MSRRQLLTREEEIDLLEQFRSGNDRAGMRIALGYEALILSTANHFYRLNQRFVEKGDVINAGFEGFMIALRNVKKGFDYSRGYRFGTYARPWIRKSIASLIRHERWWAPSIPERTHNQVIKIFVSERKLRNSLGSEPTLADLANDSGMSLSTVQKLKGWLNSDEVISLSLPTGDGSSSLDGVLRDRWIGSPLSVVADADMRDTVSNVLRTLSPRQDKIIRLRFGIGCEREHSIEEIAAEFDLTAQQVRRIHDAAIENLRGNTPSWHLRAVHGGVN